MRDDRYCVLATLGTAHFVWLCYCQDNTVTHVERIAKKYARNEAVQKNSETNCRLKDLFVEGRIILNLVFDGMYSHSCEKEFSGWRSCRVIWTGTVTWGSAQRRSAGCPLVCAVAKQVLQTNTRHFVCLHGTARLQTDAYLWCFLPEMCKHVNVFVEREQINRHFALGPTYLHLTGFCMWVIFVRYNLRPEKCLTIQTSCLVQDTQRKLCISQFTV